MSSAELSENIPVALNCWVVPCAIDEFDGVIAIDTSWAALIVSVVLPEIPPDVAVIVTGPTLAPIARPDSLTVAFEVSEEDHKTDAVRFCVVLSE